MQRFTAKEKLVSFVKSKTETSALLTRMLLRRQISWPKLRCAAQNFIGSRRNNGRLGPTPTVLMIEPVSGCNLDCLFCPAGKNTVLPDHVPRGVMPLGHYKELIDDCHPHVSFIALFFYGEPYLHKNIHTMISYATERRLNVRLSTNGHFFANDEVAKRTVESGLDTAMISISGASQASYEKFHVGGDFDKVVRGVKNLLRIRKELRSRTPRVSLRYLITAENHHEMKEMREVAREINPDYVSFRPVYADSLEEAQEHSLVKDYAGRGGSTGDTEGLPINKDFCGWPWLMSVIRWNGEVAPCCSYILALPHTPPPLGNAVEAGGIQKVWGDRGYLAMRKQMSIDKSKFEICKHCQPLKFNDLRL